MKTNEWYSNEDNKIKIPGLVGKTVVEVIHFSNGPFSEGWILTFDDGSRLTATDGEYGDDSFRFLKEGESPDG